jgi:multicomponent K+:H+ antiporter subunit E
MRRILPFPFLSAGLLVMWLLLNQTLAAGQVILGGLLALVAPWILAALEPPNLRIRRPVRILRLSFQVLADIARSNVAVGLIVLQPKRRTHEAGFVDIPLELSDHYGLAALACIITSTPGTLWVNFEPATGILTIHVLDLVDRESWIRTIKDRYERPLMEIFA